VAFPGIFVSLDDPYLSLAIALGIGLLLGIERGWQEREAPEGSRTAGFRTFGVLGVTGGALGLMTGSVSAAVAAGVAAGTAALLVVGYWQRAARRARFSLTTELAALLTLALGMLATTGRASLAAATAVVVAILLQTKAELHALLRRLSAREVRALLQLLLLAVVILPLLPDRGFGPLALLNPYRIAVAVLVVAAMSFAGYIATRVARPERGLLWTGLLGGLASSTAATLTLARRCRADGLPAQPVASAIVGACAVMMARMTILLGVLVPGAALVLAAPVIAMGLTAGVIAFIGVRRAEFLVTGPLPLANPLELGMAVKLAALIVLVMAVASVLQAQFGVVGTWAVAAVAGLVDVDAITLTVARVTSHSGVGLWAGALALGIAAAANMLAKIVAVRVLAGTALAARIAAAFAAVLAAGAACLAVVAIW
jgi:uncharacterized membrane protein (DUF4010 family)